MGSSDNTVRVVVTLPSSRAEALKVPLAVWLEVGLLVGLGCGLVMVAGLLLVVIFNCNGVLSTLHDRSEPQPSCTQGLKPSVNHAASWER